METSKFMFSASSVKEYMQCGIKFKYGRIDKLPRAETYSHHRWFGTLVHSVIYTAIGKHTTSKDMDLHAKINEVFPLKIFEALWQEKETDDPIIQMLQKDLGPKPVGKFIPGKIKSLGKDIPDFPQDKLEKGWKAEAKKMVKNGIEIVTKIPEIVELEKKMFWTIQGKRFIGFSDIVAKDADGKFEYYDLKTSWDKPGNKLDNDFQFFAYSLALKDLYKLDYFPKGYYVHLRSGSLVEFELTPYIFGKMMSILKGVFSDIENNVFLPDYGGPLCPYCDFRHVCYGKDENIWRR